MVRHFGHFAADCMSNFRPFSCRGFHPLGGPMHRLCPSCSQKLSLLFAEYLDERRLSRLMKLAGIRTKTAAVDWALRSAEHAARREKLFATRWEEGDLGSAIDPACSSSIHRSISIYCAPVGVRAMSFGPPWKRGLFSPAESPGSRCCAASSTCAFARGWRGSSTK